MTTADPINRKSPVAAIVGLLVLLGVLAFIGWGLWLAYHPAPVPLQGQVEARTLNIAPKISARIATLPVREGQAVAAGTVLVTLDSPEVRAKLAQAGAVQAAADARRDLVDVGARAEDIRVAKAMWDKATAAVELADKTYQRLNALYKEGLVSLQRNDEAQTNYKAALETALAAKAQYDTALTGARPQEKRAAGAAALQAAGGVAEVDAAALELVLKAPRAAHVDKVVLHAGELAGAGFPILTLVDLADIWVVFNIREDDFAGIKIGAVLDGSVPALGNKKVGFVIDTISPRGDYATWRATRQSSGYDVRTFEVRARPQAPVEGLRPGMSVLVEAR
jgi:HlyD family secretion protein